MVPAYNEEDNVDRVYERLHAVLEGLEGFDEADPAVAPAGDGITADELGRELRTRPEVVHALDRMWPLLAPQLLEFAG